MLESGIIERSESPYCSPVIIVKKKDNTNRFCIDFRVLNKITVFDAEPMPSMEQIFAKLAGYKFISKLDLLKGYWQMYLFNFFGLSQKTLQPCLTVPNRTQLSKHR